MVMLGVLPTTAVNPAGANGLIHGNWIFLPKELAAVLGASVWACAFSLGALKLINLVTRVRVTRAEEEVGPDKALHGESAYEPDAEPV